MIYELAANTFAAMFLGFASGILVSVLATSLFHIVVELPLDMDLPINTMLAMFLFTSTSLYFGA